jgi:hypothetical protein
MLPILVRMNNHLFDLVVVVGVQQTVLIQLGFDFFFITRIFRSILDKIIDLMYKFMQIEQDSRKNVFKINCQIQKVHEILLIYIYMILNCNYPDRAFRRMETASFKV